MNRRDLLQKMGLGVAGLPELMGGAAVGMPAPDQKQPLPLFVPQSFGAVGDGKTLDSPAINAAILRAREAGGGVVYLRPGVYLCGTVVLQSFVTLYLEAGAVLLGSKDINQYTPQPSSGASGDTGHKHLLFAQDAEDVSIVGGGVINGQGKSFWVPSGRKPPAPEDAWGDVATLYWKALPRVSPMIELVNCRRLRIEHVRIEESAGWTMRLINCNSVVVDGVSIRNPIYGINVDGMDITNCSDVRIANCSIQTADDAICLKGENPYGSSVPPSRNIAVTNCTISGCCNGFKIGTRTEGAFENIVFSNSVIHNDDVPLSERIISGICLEMVDGGSVDGVTITGIRMQRTRVPIFVRVGNRTPGKTGKPGTLRNVSIADVVATGAVATSSITGVPDGVVENVTLANVRIDTEVESRSEWATRDVPEKEKAYPESRMFGRLPAWGLYCRHVRGLRLQELWLSSGKAQQTPVMVCDAVQGVEVDGLRADAATSAAAMLAFRNVQGGWVRGTQAVAGAGAFLQLSGDATRDIAVSGCDLRAAAEPVAHSGEVPADAVRMAGNLGREK